MGTNAARITNQFNICLCSHTFTMVRARLYPPYLVVRPRNGALSGPGDSIPYPDEVPDEMNGVQRGSPSRKAVISPITWARLERQMVCWASGRCTTRAPEWAAAKASA